MEEVEEEPPSPSKLKLNNLPKDIIFDIFSRIPLKSLCQFRIVCKKWQFILCLNPEFRLFYHQKHKINPILLFNHLSPEPPSTHFSSYFIDGTPLSQISTTFAQPLISILTCNGILCLVSEKNRVFLYDPITRLHSQLPNSTSFDSSLSWAFGFSRFRNVFKLLHFYTIDKFDNFNYCPLKEIMCEIVTTPISDLWVDDHLQVEWRDLGFCPFQFSTMKNNYAFVDGKFYWLIKAEKMNQKDIKIMSFDLETEVFAMVNYMLIGPMECLDLVEINERLCMTHRMPWEESMSIWVMKKEFDGIGDFWVKNYWIDLKGGYHHDVKILGYFPRNDKSNDEDEGELLMKFGKQSFGFYGIDDGVFRDMSSEVNLDKWGLEFLLNRKSLL